MIMIIKIRPNMKVLTKNFIKINGVWLEAALLLELYLLGEFSNLCIKRIKK